MIEVKIKRRFGWRTLKGTSYEWISGRTTACGVTYHKEEGAASGQILKKIGDVSFPLQLAVTLSDGTIEYVPDIQHKQIRIREF